jgi:hypothetical protein
MKNDFNELKEAIGSGLLPLFEKLASGISSVARFFTPMQSQLKMISDESATQQVRFRTLIDTYEKLRFQQGESTTENHLLKTVISQLNSEFGSYMGTIDLTTASYEELRKAISKTTDEMLRESRVKLIRAEYQELIDETQRLGMKITNETSKWNAQIDRYIMKSINASNGYMSAVYSNEARGARARMNVALKDLQGSYDEALNNLKDFEQRYSAEIAESEAERAEALRKRQEEDAEAREAHQRRILEEEEKKRQEQLARDREQYERDIAALRKSLLSQEEAVRASYAERFKTIETYEGNVGKLKDKNLLTRKLEENMEKELKALRLQGYKDEIDILERKRDLNFAFYEDLKGKVDEYVDWVKAKYTEEKDFLEGVYKGNSKEYLDALSLQRNATERHLNEIKQMHADNVNSLMDMWRADTNNFELGAIDDKQLKESIDGIIAELERLKKETGEGSDEWRAYANAIREIKGPIQETLSAGEVFAQNMQEYGQSIKDSFEDLGNGMSRAIGDAFADMLFEGKKFAIDMKALFKQLVSTIISELMRLMVIKSILSLIPGLAPVAVAAASGGLIHGPGTGTSDSIPARLSHGDDVMKAKTTAHCLPMLD